MISIVTATYNRANTLQRTIDSVLKQTLQDWELIIVDDGSTDDTHSVLERLTDPRIRVVSHSSNRGVCAAKNTGLNNIRGDWFAILDSDDELVPAALERLMHCAEETGATAVNCHARDFVSGECTGTGFGDGGWVSAKQAAQTRGDHWGITSTSLLRNRRLDEQLPGFETTLWLKIDAEANRYFIPEALLVVHTEGMDRMSRQPWNLRRRVRMWSRVGEDKEYLAALRRANLKAYCRVVWRVAVMRLLSPFLRA